MAPERSVRTEEALGGPQEAGVPGWAGELGRPYNSPRGERGTPGAWSRSLLGTVVPCCAPPPRRPARAAVRLTTPRSCVAGTVVPSLPGALGTVGEGARTEGRAEGARARAARDPSGLSPSRGPADPRAALSRGDDGDLPVTPGAPKGFGGFREQFCYFSFHSAAFDRGQHKTYKYNFRKEEVVN